jgi:hypothetical protein
MLVIMSASFRITRKEEIGMRLRAAAVGVQRN